MYLSAKRFHATFSVTANRWTIKTEEFEFDVQYLKIQTGCQGCKKVRLKKRFAAFIQEVIAEDVVFDLRGNIVTIRNYSKIEKKSHYDDLWNPDFPRNLAKSVTVH